MLHGDTHTACMCVSFCLLVFEMLSQTKSRIEKLLESENWRLYNRVSCNINQSVYHAETNKELWVYISLAAESQLEIESGTV